MLARERILKDMLYGATVVYPWVVVHEQQPLPQHLHKASLPPHTGSSFCDSCWNRSSQHGTVGLFDDKLAECLSLYPNPFTDALTVTSPCYPAKVELIDARGRVVFSQQQASSSTQFALPEVAPGASSLHVRGEGCQEVFRPLLVKQ